MAPGSSPFHLVKPEARNEAAAGSPGALPRELSRGVLTRTRLLAGGDAPPTSSPENCSQLLVFRVREGEGELGEIGPLTHPPVWS